MAASLLRAFPAALAREVEAVLALLPTPQHDPSEGFEVVVQGETLDIPTRIYHPEPTRPPPTALGAAILHCLYTRHHNGFVRQRHLEGILGRDEPWIPAFVLPLVGEYVIEIVQDIERRLPALNAGVYAAFLRENPRLLPLLRQRGISYWNRNDRFSLRKREDYPSLRVVSTLEAWLSAGPTG